MKNKNLIYVLMPLVILIWGLIIYKIIAGMNDDKPSNSVYKPLVTEDSKELTDTFSLYANYNDPFLSGTVRLSRNVVETEMLSNRRSLSNVNNTPPKPDLQYFGIISNAKNKYKVGLIKIQGVDYLLKEGDFSVNKLKVYKLFKDSVIVMQQNYKHTIHRI